MTKLCILFITLFLILNTVIFAQDSAQVNTLTLDEVIGMAVDHSPSIKYHQNRNVNYYWRWKNFQANFRPQLGISGDLPDYQQSYEPMGRF